MYVYICMQTCAYTYAYIHTSVHAGVDMNIAYALVSIFCLNIHFNT